MPGTFVSLSPRLTNALPAAAFALAAAAILARAAVRCFGSDLRALAATLQDDSLYYLLPAFRFHTHGMWTFDGENATYGVQPLFAVFLTALAWPFDDRDAFLRTAIFASHVLFVAAAALVVRVVWRATAAPAAAWLAGAAFLCSVPLLLAHTTGKENALYAPLLLVAVLCAIRTRESPTNARLTVLGVAAAATILTRLQPSTLAVAVVVVLWAVRTSPHRLRAAATAVLTLWSAIAWSTFGRVLPTSGSVKTEWLHSAWHDGSLADRLRASAELVPGYLVDALAFATGNRSELFVPQWWTGTAEAGGVLAVCVVVALVVGIVRSNALATTRLFTAGLLAALVGTAVNPLLFDAGRDATLLRYAQWYVAAEPVWIACLVGIALPRRDLGRAFAPLAAAATLALGIGAAARLPPLPPFAPLPTSAVHRAIAVTELANDVLPKDARIGAWNGGVVGWFAHRTVVNLDGLANDAAAAARAAGVPQRDYLRSARVDHLLDMPPPRGWFDTNVFDRVQPIHSTPARDDADAWILARLTDEPFPDLDGSHDGADVDVRRWLAPAGRSLVLPPRGELRFHLGGRAAEFRAHASSIAVFDDERLLARVPPTESAALLRVAVHGVQLLRVVNESARAVEIADIAFATTTELPPPPRPPRTPDADTDYGAGRTLDGRVPALSTHRAAADDPQLRFTITDLPSDADASVLVGQGADSVHAGDGWRLLVAPPLVATLRVERDADDASRGGAQATLPRRPDGAPWYAQVVCTRGGRVVATSRGLRVTR